MTGSLFDAADPDGWFYGDETGPPYIDQMPEPPQRGPGSADTLNLADFTVGEREVICSTCWLVHRPGVECG
ncbi:MAG: hypothetical protein JO214_15690 [Frankiaceae bacterium]|nr:hypothetical protein [Frankiaceae bacterium]